MKRLAAIFSILIVSFLMGGCLEQGKKDVVYGEFRLSDQTTGVDLVGYGKLYSRAECYEDKQRFLDMWLNGCATCGKVSFKCLDKMPERYDGLFNDQPIHATYLAYHAKDATARDARVIIFGVPSSAANAACMRLKGMVAKGYKGTVSCVKGTVG